jgi:hypothetical protein
VVHQSPGATLLTNGEANVAFEWLGHVGNHSRLADGIYGIYRIHMNSFSLERSCHAKLTADVTAVEGIAKAYDAYVIDQVGDMRVCNPPTPTMQAFNTLKKNPGGAKSDKRNQRNRKICTRHVIPSLHRLLPQSLQSNQSFGWRWQCIEL